MQVIETSNVPIKAWVDGVEFEPEAQQQAKNIASMPFIYKHVAIMPDAHWGNGATVGSVIATRGAIIPAAVGVDLGCFIGETRIPLLNGTQKRLDELIHEKEPFWVYSIDSEKRIVPGRARCIRTRENAELVKVTVSGGDEIICTPDHEFMMQDGSYRQASELRCNDSLMPLYRKWETRDGYENVSNGKGNSRLTHKMIWEYFNGPRKEGMVVHHKNNNHFDNTPENLQLMTASEHSKLHRAEGHVWKNHDPEFQKQRMNGIQKYWNSGEDRSERIEISKRSIIQYMQSRPEHFKESTKENGKRGAPYLAKFNTTPRACNDCGHVSDNPAYLNWHKKKQHGYNHKVISVEKLVWTEDVYCLQVEEHHNFALAAGVFVHNCGMSAVRTNLKASDLPDSLSSLRSEIESRIPHGRTNEGGPGDKGAWNPGFLPTRIWEKWIGGYKTPLPSSLQLRFKAIVDKHPKIEKSNHVNHLGTLGTGNHFVEVCIDQNQDVWVMLHSGSRGVGGRIGTYFIELAKQDMKKWFINLPDVNLAYIVEGSEHFDDYMEAVGWAQDYARLNRELMMEAALGSIANVLKRFISTNQWAINCHHNYVERENHFGSNVLVTRKGAVRAREGDLGIIPGSMGTRSYIVRGKGNRDSFCSCSHGAGRRLSRNKAKKLITLEDHAKATEGVECRKDEDVIDESPACYKSIDKVMEAQKDLVEVVCELKQVLCVKG